jgi:hypothetical protein
MNSVGWKNISAKIQLIWPENDLKASDKHKKKEPIPIPALVRCLLSLLIK